MKLKNFFTKLHNNFSRDYFSRMNSSKPEIMKKAKKYDFSYWDGKRSEGYGGYKYMEGYWRPLAKKLINTYKLTNKSSLLDIGCGKGFLLYEIKKILPKLKIIGFDISKYAIKNSHPKIKKYLSPIKAQDKYPLKKKSIDLVISLGTLHNLNIYELSKAFFEINRVAKKSYIWVESYRNEVELCNLQCWAFTCKSFYDPSSWKWIFKKFNYKGDYEFIYFK
ncbi:methyltransferase domain-containing protein [Candidatus Pelagibacter sp.]|nr:methyltransferase domain-containing protein [Candidatus Pelagibacter sp.]